MYILNKINYYLSILRIKKYNCTTTTTNNNNPNNNNNNENI